MVGAPWMSRALGALGTAALVVLTAPAAAHAVPTGPATAHDTAHATTHATVRTGVGSSRAATARDPLRVTIDALSPSTIPRTGKMTISGTVTNDDDETWRSIRVHPYASSTPMRNQAELAKAASLPETAYVGDNPVTATRATEIPSLAPHASAGFTVVVPASSLTVDGGGVYWLSIRAFGESADHGDDGNSDGRARTFLPYVPKRVTGQLPLALVAPVLRAVPYADDGSVEDVTDWTRSLGPNGRLGRLLDFVGAAGATPVTWLVDPAVLDAVDRLSRGNPPRSLAPDPTDADDGDASDGASGSPSSDPTATASPDDGTGTTATPDGGAADQATRDTASGWLDAFKATLPGKQVLTVPYGDLDVAAAVRDDPGLFHLAQTVSSPELSALGITASTALTTPSGYLAPQTLAQAPARATVLASDRAVSTPAPPTVASVDGHSVVVTSSGASAGGPGPGPALTAVELRQRILSEAAVRVIKADQRPLVVVLPTQWALDGAGGFFAGLDVPWLRAESLQTLVAGTTPKALDDDALRYPRVEERRELRPRTLESARRLIATGARLQHLLARNTSISAEVTRQGLSEVSYGVRSTQLAARARLNLSRSWLTDRLDDVTITAPKGVTLASASGKFAATITNRLDQPVTVGVAARSDPGITLRSPQTTIDLAPHSHTTVILEAHATTNKVHNVTLLVTDSSGTPLGPQDSLPIRSVQVSEVIWIIMGGGGVLLFGAIAVRLVRRVRAGWRPRGRTAA